MMGSVHILYFFHHPDCEHCKKAEPILDEWKSTVQAKHGFQLHVIKLDLSRYNWIKHGFEPKKTPAYAYVIDNELRVHFEGAITTKTNLDKFIKAGE